MINILFTADENYAKRIPTVVQSIRVSHPDTKFSIHLICDEISAELEDRLSSFCGIFDYPFAMYRVEEDLFDGAPLNKHYSKAMYYRLLASYILPDTIDRILYLDPDLLVINPLMPLYGLDLKDRIFAAASHTEETMIVDNINRMRLDTTNVYFNTGILLMDLKRCREVVKSEEIFSMTNGEKLLLLPDQDVFNGLYGDMTMRIPDEIWNYDVRKYAQYHRRSNGIMDEYWVIKNTAVLHYCGKSKPWNDKYRFRFSSLYRHYEQLAQNTAGERGV